MVSLEGKRKHMTPRILQEPKQEVSAKRCTQCGKLMRALPSFVTHAMKPMYCSECEKVEFWGVSEA